MVSVAAYADAAELCRAALTSRGVLVALDRITDPGNLGAVVRSAAAAEAVGILLGGEGTVGLTPVVAKASAGTLERIPVAREPRLRKRLMDLRTQGFRVVVLDGRGDIPWDRADLSGPVVLVAGGEGAGVRTGLREVAEQTVAIPLGRGVESLNVSAAVAVVLFEAVRQRRARTVSGSA